MTRTGLVVLQINHPNLIVFHFGLCYSLISMTKIIPFIVKITYEEASKDAPFVAYSPEFDVASAGLTKAQAKKNLSEALSLPRVLLTCVA